MTPDGQAHEQAAAAGYPRAAALIELFQANRKLEEVVEAATRAIRELAHARAARVWIQRGAGGRLWTVELDEATGRAGPEHRQPRGEGLAGWVVERGQPLRLGSGDPRPELRGAIPPFASALVLPLFRRGAAFGAVECLDRAGEDSFSDADVARLSAAAEELALALDNVLLDREAERRALEKDVLLQVSKTLSLPLELDETLEAILRSLREVVRYDAAAIYLVNRKTGAVEQVRDIGYPEGSEDVFRLQVGQGIVGWVAKTGSAVIVAETARDPRYVAARPSTQSELAAPLVLEGETIGVFNLESDRPDTYTEDHLELVEAFASQAALAIERARALRERLERRHLERELSIAREIQATFLPKSAPRIPNFELAGLTRPHAEVGGDYFDFIRIGEHRIGLAIADVSGKGIPAALIMAGFRASLLAEIRNEFAIRAVMSKVNSLLLESSDPGKFVTCFYGLLDVQHRALVFCNAGHNPPILRRADGRMEALMEGGVALGIVPGAQYEDRPLTLRPGDVLVLYTDGITESMDAMKQPYGQTRLEETIERLHASSAQEILDGIVRGALDWSGEEEQSDDLTVIVVKATD
jgi:sigma-B regulation protein RsbU (phosphoserine phosphatase)